MSNSRHRNFVLVPGAWHGGFVYREAPVCPSRHVVSFSTVLSPGRVTFVTKFSADDTEPQHGPYILPCGWRKGLKVGQTQFGRTLPGAPITSGIRTNLERTDIVSPSEN
jgi:hypothetical protein